MNDRLRAMQLRMMGFEPVADSVSPQNSAPGPAGEVGRLRQALAVERRARVEAEARLRAVLAEIARQPTAPRAFTPSPSFVEPLALPAPASNAVVTVEPTEVIEVDRLGAMKSVIMEGDFEEVDEE